MNSTASPAIPPSVSKRPALAIATDAAYLAGSIILKHAYSPKQGSCKGRANTVTNVDLETEKAVLELLRREYPDFGIESEESEAVTTGSPYKWVVDPIDGTRNYISGIPHFGVVVALACNDQIVLGVTYDPVRRELFRAEVGKGAFLNDRPMAVSPREELDQCLLGFDMGYSDERARRALDLVRDLWPGMQSIRIMGSAALGLAYAAAGRIDLYFHHHLAPWDLASGLLLAREAGGVVMDRLGGEATLRSTGVISSSPRLVERFLQATEGMAWRQ